MKDFTIQSYLKLLQSLQKQGFSFQTFSEFLSKPKKKSIILRHDVDMLPENSLVTAKLEHSLGISGSYYFRVVSCSWDENIIVKIAEMGHEIGYHYETMDTCNGNVDLAYEEFCKIMEKFRKIYPVKTICMHGSPRSAYDNKDIWKKYNYKNLGIIGEPYFDIDFNKVFYLTDTGRCWDGNKFSIRDKVSSSFNLSFHGTQQIIDAANKEELPDQIMFTVHPQRWSDSLFNWTKELVMQNIKNQVKYFIGKRS
jgi:hypothetical protein